MALVLMVPDWVCVTGSRTEEGQWYRAKGKSQSLLRKQKFRLLQTVDPSWSRCIGGRLGKCGSAKYPVGHRPFFHNFDNIWHVTVKVSLQPNSSLVQNLLDRYKNSYCCKTDEIPALCPLGALWSSLRERLAWSGCDNILVPRFS